ncbi:MAG: hypothetical protein WEB03_06130 [Nitriliruptor sp.]|uniref:hypothetical protein n=1 Tax=Nitriliruptor sp. TaxID=2448056 RepID=UPI0034A07BAE
MLLTGLLLLAQCTTGGDDDPAPSGDDGASEEAAPEDEAPPCEATPEAARDLDAGAAPFDAAGAITASFGCVQQVVAVPADQPASAAVAAPLAVELGAPLLIGDEAGLAATLAELGDPEVRHLEPAPGTSDDADTGDAGTDGATGEATDGEGEPADDIAAADPTETDGDTATDDPDAGATEPAGAVDLATALEVADELGTDRFVAADADRPEDLTAAAAVAIRTSAAVLPVAVDGPAPELPEGSEVVAVGDLGDLLPDAETVDEPWELDDGADRALVIDPTDPNAPSAVVLATQRGDTVVPAPNGDLLGRGTVQLVRDADLDTDQLVAVGEFDGDLDGDLTLLVEAPLLPGGTLRHFDGTRMVAMYGKPGAPVLGVLGEQDLEASFDRVRDISAGYDADGRDVVPGFEVIATVASAEAGDDGKYSRVTPPEEFRELVDRAAEEDVQVILDLQPGRNHFLDQAKIYEDLLREPHVGLALDPEWRLEDDQVHLRQIGSVDAAEVQEVIDWYAELARDAGVAEKLLVLHQFRVDMLPDRDILEVPREVAVIIHMDGQGPQGMKLETWGVLTSGAEDRWHWAWKNFYDEDPVVAEPSYILDLDPEVVLVTYQ